MQRIYEGYDVPGTQSNFPGDTTNYSGNYNQPEANGPGHTPIQVTGGPSTGDIIEMPHVDRMTSRQLLSLIQQGVEQEIKRAKDKEMIYAMKRFKNMYNFLIKLEEHQIADDEEEESAEESLE